MASELVDKLKETLQPQEHTALRGESRSSERPQQQHNTHRENVQSFSGQTYENENPGRNENTSSLDRNEYESSTQNLESEQPQRHTKQQVKSMLGDIQGAMPGSTQRHKEKPSRKKAEFDPRDAASVPPSVFAQHVGEPSIQHKFANDSRTRRHSVTSHQEQHYHTGQDH